MKTAGKYADFLVDKEVYFENQTFWTKELAALSQYPSEPWVITQFANGEDFLDGNPIASALYRQLGKAVRIIQTNLDVTVPPLRAWLEKAQFQATSITELVVVVQPSEESFNAAINLIAFFTSETNTGKLNRYVRTINVLYRQLGIVGKQVTIIRTMNPQQSASLEDTIKKLYQSERKKRPVGK